MVAARLFRRGTSEDDLVATLPHLNPDSDERSRPALDIPILIVGCIALAFVLTGAAVLLAKYAFGWMG